MNDNYLTLVGNVATDPEARRTPTGIPVTSFRMVSTSRRLDREKNEWVDSGQLWVTVKCWRGLAENVAASMRKGQPIVAYWRYYGREWTTQEETKRISYELDAISVGHDLTRGTASFSKAQWQAFPASVPADVEEREMAEAQLTAEDDASDVDRALSAVEAGFGARSELSAVH